MTEQDQPARNPATVDETRRSQALARQVVTRLEPDAQVQLLDWTRKMLAVRAARLPRLAKALWALRLTEKRKVVSLLAQAGEPLKDLAWGDRTWSARLGLSAAAVAAVTTAGQGAGIALLGTAIGVPLWVVIGAGASFAGSLVDELEAELGRRARSSWTELELDAFTAEWIEDAEWESISEAPDAPLVLDSPPVEDAPRNALVRLSDELQSEDPEESRVLQKALRLLRKMSRRSVVDRLRRFGNLRGDPAEPEP